MINPFETAFCLGSLYHNINSQAVVLIGGDFYGGDECEYICHNLEEHNIERGFVKDLNRIPLHLISKYFVGETSAIECIDQAGESYKITSFYPKYEDGSVEVDITYNSLSFNTHLLVGEFYIINYIDQVQTLCRSVGIELNFVEFSKSYQEVMVKEFANQMEKLGYLDAEYVQEKLKEQEEEATEE